MVWSPVKNRHKGRKLDGGWVSHTGGEWALSLGRFYVRRDTGKTPRDYEFSIQVPQIKSSHETLNCGEEGGDKRNQTYSVVVS